jgi:hypothetical protein
LTSQPQALSTEVKLDLILWFLVQQQNSIAALDEKVTKVMTEQADFDTRIAALAAFLETTLPAALAAIQTELADRGVTNLASLDSLVDTDLPAVQTTLTGLVPPTTTPPVTPTS